MGFFEMLEGFADDLCGNNSSDSLFDVSRETRTEREWSLFGSGDEKQVLYEGGRKVGEVKNVKTPFGDETNVYIGDKKVGEVKRGFGSDENVHYHDKNLGPIDRGRDPLGNRDLERGRGGVTHIRGGGLDKLLDERKERKHSPRESDINGYSRNGYSAAYSSTVPRSEDKPARHSIFAQFFGFMANLNMIIGRKTAAQKWCVHASEANISDRNFELAGEYAEYGGLKERAIKLYYTAGSYHNVFRLVNEDNPHPVREESIRFGLLAHVHLNQYIEAAILARKHGLEEKAQDYERLAPHYQPISEWET